MCSGRQRGLKFAHAPFNMAAAALLLRLLTAGSLLCASLAGLGDSSVGAFLNAHHPRLSTTDASPLHVANATAHGYTGRARRAGAGLQQQTCAAAAAPRPHIVVFLFDDMGYNDMGDFQRGSKDQCTTPHLNRLMDEGIRLKQFYSMPLCSPTRAALMTGRYPIRYGEWGLPLRKATAKTPMGAISATVYI